MAGGCPAPEFGSDDELRLAQSGTPLSRAACNPHTRIVVYRLGAHIDFGEAKPMMPRRLACIAAVILLSGCSLGDAPTAPPTIPPPGLTLPPAWTPTPTSTLRPPASTTTPAPTGTPRASSETSTRTPAPPLERATAAAGSLEIAGWKRIDTGHAYFWLPQTYEVADLGGLGDMMEILMIALVQGLTEGFQELAGAGTPGPTPTMMSLEEMRAGFDIDLLMAAEKDLGAAVFVVGEPVAGTPDLAALLDEAVQGVKGLREVKSRHLVEGAPYPTARAIVTAEDPESGSLSQQALYVVHAKDRSYTFSCQTSPADFASMLLVFERSALSLTPHPPAE
ncbi:MAG: hypothetical protein A2Z30_03040 [Chloroflexi bacterium RBG_16_64_43]|nr:MAG: hypothetical protein A2Z30_03040 [Chloroflexi bacterium RBG_16_64_43]